MTGVRQGQSGRHVSQPRLFWNDGGSLVILTRQAIHAWQSPAINAWQSPEVATVMDHDSTGSSDYDRVLCIEGYLADAFRVGQGWAIALPRRLSQGAVWLPSASADCFYAIGFEWVADMDPDRLRELAGSARDWAPVSARMTVEPQGLLLAHASSTMTGVREMSALIEDGPDTPATMGDGLRFVPPPADYVVDECYLLTDDGESLLVVRFRALRDERARTSTLGETASP